MTSLLTSLLGRLGNLVPVVVFAFFAYQAAVYIYNVFLHPLRKFPGPIYSAASTLPIVYQTIKGDAQFWIIDLHQKYGEVVRVSPNELSYSSAQAWKDIYGHRKGGKAALQKDPRFYMHPPGDDEVPTTDIISSGDFDHSRIRRIFSNAFSDKALKMQEPLFLVYIDRLIQKMRKVIQNEPQHKFNMVSMYNFTTFDVMGDLTFGEPLNLLEDTTYHGWLASMFAGFKFGAYLQSARYYPLLLNTLMSMMPASLEEKRKQHNQFSVARVDRRLANKDPRPDIWGLVLQRDEESGLSLKEMYANANLFMIAGTETTATLLSGLTYHLLKNPDKLKELTEEIRGAFPQEGDITIERLQALKYLNACVEEGLRMFPPVSNGLPRVIPQEGAEIDGRQIPGGATVFVTHLAAYRNPNNFSEPYSFIPERWISEKYASDKKHALQPFSTGPRNCLGKNMAYHEIRLILSKVLYNFDLKLCSESENWADQKIFIMWDKPQLWCRLVAVERDL